MILNDDGDIGHGDGDNQDGDDGNGDDGDGNVDEDDGEDDQHVPQGALGLPQLCWLPSCPHHQLRHRGKVTFMRALMLMVILFQH